MSTNILNLLSENISNEEKIKIINTDLNNYIKNESKFINDEILSVGINDDISIRSTTFLKVLEDIKVVLGDKYQEFLVSCDFNSNDIAIIKHSLDKNGLNVNTVNAINTSLEDNTLDAIKNYRESPQLRKDIKNTYNGDINEIEYLQPLLSYLVNDVSPSVRMEIWQKIELYFNSGWGLADLNSESNDDHLVLSFLKSNLDDIKGKKATPAQAEKIMNLLEIRIQELGVVIEIKNNNNIQNDNIPTASIKKDLNEKVFNKRKVTRAGFVDWAIPDYNNPSKLHFSLATSDETLSIENSQAFRYAHAIDEYIKSPESKFSEINLSFFGVSNFYNEVSNVNQTMLGSTFINRFKIQDEDINQLNILPYLSMANTISSNYGTGIYDPKQLFKYNFYLVGAQSALDSINESVNNNEVIDIYAKSISSLLNIFNRDNSIDTITDRKTLQVVKYLSDLLSVAQNEFFENEEIQNILFNDNTSTILENILDKLPNASMSSNLINKNDFQKTIDTISFIDVDTFVKKKNIRKERALSQKNQIDNLEKLLDNCNKLNKINESIVDISSFDESWINKSNDERLNIVKEQVNNLFNLVKNPKVLNPIDVMKKSKNTKFDDMFKDDLNKLIAYKKDKFKTENLTVNQFMEIEDIELNLFNKKNINISKFNGLSRLAFAFNFVNSVDQVQNTNLTNFVDLIKFDNINKNFSLPEANNLFADIKNLTSFISSNHINNVLNNNQCYIELADIMKKEIIEKYTKEDISFVESKINLNTNLTSSIKNNDSSPRDFKM